MEQKRNQLTVRFHHEAERPMNFSAIVGRMEGKWLFCRHRQRQTLECPGGHIEPGETPEEAARRELYEETGALEYELFPVCAYSVIRGEEPPSWGMLFAAEISRLGPLPPLEIAQVQLLADLPGAAQWTYPQIQPALLRRAAACMGWPVPPG